MKAIAASLQPLLTSDVDAIIGHSLGALVATLLLDKISPSSAKPSSSGDDANRPGLYVLLLDPPLIKSDSQVREIVEETLHELHVRANAEQLMKLNPSWSDSIASAKAYAVTQCRADAVFGLFGVRRGQMSQFERAVD